MTTTPVSAELSAKLDELVAELNVLERERHAAAGYSFAPDVVRWYNRLTFAAIDIGSSGAWLVEKATGEIYNIKAYGVADRNKKAKADLGNVFTVDARKLYAGRYNYLRGGRA